MMMVMMVMMMMMMLMTMIWTQGMRSLLKALSFSLYRSGCTCKLVLFNCISQNHFSLEPMRMQRLCLFPLSRSAVTIKYLEKRLIEDKKKMD